MRLLILVVGLLGCRHSPEATAPPVGAGAEQDPTWAALNAAVGRANAGDCPGAIDITSDALAKAPQPAEGHVLRANRVEGQTAALFTALQIMQEGVSGGVVSSVWADLYYLQGYCYADMERWDEAEAALKGGLNFIPGDFMLSSELGHVYQVRKDWEAGLTQFNAAVTDVRWLAGTPGFEDNADATVWGAPLAVWEGRALRGAGFSLIELGRLDEAVTAYEAALEINPKDQQARSELELIARLKAGQAP